MITSAKWPFGLPYGQKGLLVAAFEWKRGGHPPRSEVRGFHLTHIIASSGVEPVGDRSRCILPLKRGVLGATGRYRSLQVKVQLLRITPFKWDSQEWQGVRSNPESGGPEAKERAVTHG